jgi:hypothetical protein
MARLTSILGKEGVNICYFDDGRNGAPIVPSQNNVAFGGANTNLTLHQEAEFR